MKVLIAGTFQLIHPGHIYLIKKAAELGDVYVVVSRDKNARKIKGKLPVINEKQRLEVVKHMKNVHTAILGDLCDMLKPVEKIRPDIILLGPDQINKTELESMLKARGIKTKVLQLKKRYRSHQACSSSKMAELLRR